MRTVLLICAALLALRVHARAEDDACVKCHRTRSAALVKEWEHSKHSAAGVSCSVCHAAEKDSPTAWKHEGEIISTIVTPKTCANCHADQVEQFSRSHHAKAGEILASLDNILAEKVAGLPGNNADAVNGCLQCHGAIIKLQRDEKGNVKRGPLGQPLIDPDTWPNSGMGRLNPDGTKGSCNACHARHAFDAKQAREPENCGKCHMGPDHPQIEIYNESKHGIAYRANVDRMNMKGDSWVLGKDYSAAPTCASCHISDYMGPDGKVKSGSHDVGERISWTLRPVISDKLNLVVYEDGFKEDFPGSKPAPKVGETVETTEKVVENEKLVSRKVSRKVAKVVTWEERRAKMKGACLNCHGSQFVDGFYTQFDGLVALYNDKFAKPAKAIMDELAADGILNPKAPFEHHVQWEFWELWHHEGRRARHGASMMGPDYTHWHGMYEVSKNFYTRFLPAAVEAAEAKSPELGRKWKAKIDALLAKQEHAWKKGLSPKEAEALEKEYRKRYNQ